MHDPQSVDKNGVRPPLLKLPAERAQDVRPLTAAVMRERTLQRMTGVMPVMKRNLFIAICCATLVGACWERHWERNDDRAYFARQADGYRVEMKGRRFPLVHDPLSLLLSRTYEESWTMELPRIDGVIQGNEVQVGADKVRYAGRIVITDGKMKVDLYSGDSRHPLSWNDEYTLVQKDTAGIR